MQVWIDLGIVLFIPFMVFRGYKKGGILTFFSFLTVFVAFGAATVVSTNLCESVGRLLQPAIKASITVVLEDRLKNESIVIEEPQGMSEEELGLSSDQYLTMSRALSLLESAVELDKISGFISSARSTLIMNASEYVGSVTDIISTVLGREIARTLLFVCTFVLSMAAWILFSRVLALIFKFPGLKEINEIIGCGIGLFLALLLIFVFAWITAGGIFSWEEVQKTILFEFFVKNNPLDSFASSYSINLDL